MFEQINITGFYRPSNINIPYTRLQSKYSNIALYKMLSKTSRAMVLSVYEYIKRIFIEFKNVYV